MEQSGAVQLSSKARMQLHAHFPRCPLGTPPTRRVSRIRTAATAVAAPPAAPQGLQFKAAIDWKGIKDELDKVELNARHRNSSANPRRAVELYDEFVKLKLQADALRAERNTNSSKMKVRILSCTLCIGRDGSRFCDVHSSHTGQAGCCGEAAADCQGAAAQG